MATAVFVIAATSLAFTDGGQRRFREFLNGLKEAPAVISTTGTGTFRATISQDESEIDYALTFQDLEGDVRQAHIHIGHPQNAGGIVLWLCDSAVNPAPPRTPPTPHCASALSAQAGSVMGTLTASDVQTQAANGIAPGEFAEVIALIRAGRTYVNVHSSKFPPGEIRSQIENRDGDHHEHDNH